MVKVARRSIEKHEQRIRDLQRLITVTEQMGAPEAVGDQRGQPTPGQDVLKAALDRADKAEKPSMRIAG